MCVPQTYAVMVTSSCAVLECAAAVCFKPTFLHGLFATLSITTQWAIISASPRRRVPWKHSLFTTGTGNAPHCCVSATESVHHYTVWISPLGWMDSTRLLFWHHADKALRKMKQLDGPVVVSCFGRNRQGMMSFLAEVHFILSLRGYCLQKHIYASWMLCLTCPWGACNRKWYWLVIGQR